ncbi:acyl carrier protein [Symbioplanes lichenis]|uniref:acyl carrier protein n=1 Tax=Symbioplanes lichenis TaxID=1629072 RepID=UPI002738AA7B|nr:acyl carrier protein [Actinoplanes lichenis]
MQDAERSAEAVRDEIDVVVRTILQDDLFVEVPPELMGLDDSLRASYGLDSLGFVELRVQCENRFGVHISDDDFSPENFASIRAVTDLVRRLRPAPSPVE